MALLSLLFAKEISLGRREFYLERSVVADSLSVFS
jgi:hypothetical protein